MEPLEASVSPAGNRLPVASVNVYGANPPVADRTCVGYCTDTMPDGSGEGVVMVTGWVATVMETVSTAEFPFESVTLTENV